MATTSEAARAVTIVRTATPGNALVVNGVRNGLIASLAMAMVMMVLGAFDTGFFAAPSSIWAFFAGPSAYVPHQLSVSFVIGAMGHMMNSAMVGIAFAFIASRILRLDGTLASIAAGTTYALVLMAIMWNVLLPLGANGEIVKASAALWIWITGHVAYGMVAGLLFDGWR